MVPATPEPQRRACPWEWPEWEELTRGGGLRAGNDQETVRQHGCAREPRGSLGVCLGIDTEGSTDPFVSGNVIR
jgi:hypothetical protein